jgi:hypothetical protein
MNIYYTFILRSSVVVTLHVTHAQQSALCVRTLSFFLLSMVYTHIEGFGWSKMWDI